MRNLSGMVGEYFAKSVQKNSQEALHSNLHQDGYPDLLLTNTEERLLYYYSLFTEKMVKSILGIRVYLVHSNLAV